MAPFQSKAEDPRPVKSHKKNRLKPDRGEQFTTYFAQIYGARWPDLRHALENEPRHETLRNPFGLRDYSLDAASLLPVKHLQVEEGHDIGDLCSSPGGKSLAMIFKLGGRGRWRLNDLSEGRVKRLKAVMYDCLPDAVRTQVAISRGDASRWGLNYPATFDRVLVDAPCSGERHLVSAPAELARWSLKGAKRLTVRQHALLCAGLDALRPGGRLVYSTCSIHPLENDGVIQTLFKSRPGQFTIAKIDDEVGEPTEHGWIVLPDRFDCGPIFLSALIKN